MEVKKKLRRMTHKIEFYLFLVLAAMCIVIQIISGGQLFAANTVVDICRSMTIIGMFALINLMVVISGGFDLSFPTLASLSYSAATTICLMLDGASKRHGWHSCCPAQSDWCLACSTALLFLVSS
jgi:simple sugar transport system permease protein